MPVFDGTTQTKIAALRALRDAGQEYSAFEMVKINWPSPDGAIYYCTLQLDEMTDAVPSVTPIDVRLIPEDSPGWFMPVSLDASIGDEEIDLNLWDGDGAISDLLVTHGEGLKVELMYWFPEVDLLLTIWHGHLRQEEEAERDLVRIKAVQGFRSSDANVPHRAHWQECQAIFGGVFDTQAEINEHDCPYNRQISGGTVGNFESGSTPYTSCPRQTLAQCTARLGNARFHLSHQTISSTVINNQTSGPRLLSVSSGNETNLKEPVRAVMGTRRVYGMPVLAFRRDLNNNDPDRGFFAALYECCEGPIKNITGARFTVDGTTQNASALHYAHIFGAAGQVALNPGLSTHSYSGTALISYVFGWVNPADVEPGEASASAIIDGLRDIRVYGDLAAGPGLVATFYNDVTWTDDIGQRVDPLINFPSRTGPPIEGLGDNTWSIRWEGQITPAFSETYTFKITHDDGVKLWVNSTVVIDQLTTIGTHTGTIALTAGTPVDIRIDFFQSNSPGAHPWYCILKWSSASQAEEIVPPSALSHPGVVGGYVKQWTSNRVWQIARILTDKRWGYGLDYDRLDISSWIEAANWVDDWVRYTDAFGTNWDHVRGESHVELIERKIQQQIDDMCIGGRLSRPFLFNGKIHIVPLRALTSGELAACPEFTDEGDYRNIAWEEADEGVWKSSLKRSRKSDIDLVNRVEAVFDDVSKDYAEQPAPPVEDVDAQLAAGRVVGDNARKINPKKYTLLGVVQKAQAIKLEWGLLDLGAFDEGGLQNNLRLTFKVWFVDALDLHPFMVIKVTSSQITRYGFTYFRIMSMTRQSDLLVEIEAQAYNATYMNAFETTIVPGEPEIPPTPGPPPCILTIGTVDYQDGVLLIPIEPCV